MSQTLLPLAGFEVTFNGRFWVTAEEIIAVALFLFVVIIGFLLSFYLLRHKR